MPDHEPFDGSVPYVWKGLPHWEPRLWIAARPGDTPPLLRFPTWREAMNYATKREEPMTEQTNADLISVAEEFIGTGEPHEDLIVALAERLEAAEQEAELAEANLAVEEDKNAGYRAKNDQLAAVVEKVRELPRYNVPDPAMAWSAVDGDDLDHALATAPADLLRELKADVWDEGFRAAGLSLPTNPPQRLSNPYREEQS